LNFFKDSSLSFKTLLITWTITSVFTVIFTALQIYYEYRGERKELYNTYTIINDLYVAPISESLWIMNKSIIKTQANSLLGYPFVSYVKIYDDTSTYFEGGSIINSDVKAFNLKYSQEKIGILEIALDDTGLNQKFVKRVMVTVIIQGIKALVVCILLFFTYELLITRSLRRVSRYLISNPEATMRGEKIPFDFDREDELGVLVRNLNSFIEYIHGLNKNLKELNDSLEKKVDERTFELKQKNNQLISAIDDLERAHSQIAMSERMASLGKMTAGIAHEIKNPVYIIVNSVSLIRELLDDMLSEIPEDERKKLDLTIVDDIKDLCSRSEVSCDRVGNIINSMLSLSRTNEDEKLAVNLGVLVQKAVQFAYDATMAKNIFQCELSLDLPKTYDGVSVYKTELTRALINIFDNSFYSMFKKFSDDKKSPSILSVKLTSDDDNYIITIKDTGLGIPEEVLKNMFYPFFTTKPAGEGTGLGMSISFDIIKKHGGDIKVTSDFGSGAEFVITLPRGGMVS